MPKDVFITHIIFIAMPAENLDERQKTMIHKSVQVSLDTAMKLFETIGQNEGEQSIPDDDSEQETIKSELECTKNAKNVTLRMKVANFCDEDRGRRPPSARSCCHSTDVAIVNHRLCAGMSMLPEIAMLKW